ncbi:MAG TPA: ABC transporter permease [Chloroflexota bacterium]
MRNVLAIAERELKAYFVSPVAYVVATFFLLGTGVLFGLIINFTRTASLTPLHNNMSVLLLFLAPAVSMRLLAEEQRMGTLELLLTAPVRDVEVVLGKYLASLVFLVALLGLTLYYPFVLVMFGNPDRGPMLAGYLGVFLQGAAFLAVGLLASSLTQNQIVAGVASLFGLLVLWLADSLGSVIPGALGDAVRYLGIVAHGNDFPRGLIESSSVVYYLSLIVVALFLTVRSLEARRWRA